VVVPVVVVGGTVVLNVVVVGGCAVEDIGSVVVVETKVELVPVAIVEGVVRFIEVTGVDVADEVST
jgi:hypothetical protein